MDVQTVLVIALAVVGYGLVSRRLEPTVLTAPLLFIGFGMLVGEHGLGVVDIGVETGAVHLIAEITLIFVLFGDASRIDLRALRRELGIPVRLLGIAMPLTIAAGGGLAYLLFPELGLWQALLIGAILAPTDAALGQAVVTSKRVPQRIRQALNVESGLNDGIAVPIVLILLCIASAESESARTGSEWVWFVVKQLSLGPAVGIAVGIAGGWILRHGKRNEWFSESLERLLGIALAVIAFTGAESVGGNGFIAAFLAGLSLGHSARNVCSPVYEFLEAEGQLLMMIVFLLLGATLAWPALSNATPLVFVYAAASLTIVRMLPTAVSLIGTGVRGPTVAFLGWFGPRGLASILFAIVAVDEGTLADPSVVFAIVITTVVCSVVAHGVTAAPGANLYGALVERNPERCEAEMAEVTDHPLRVMVSRQPNG